jgi:hypothetical protein
LSDGLRLPVANADRVLRLHAKGRSPVSVLVPSGVDEVRLPAAPCAGGALFGLLPDHPIVPVALELAARGQKETIAVEGGRAFQASGLSPGAYLLSPRYRGGLRGRAQAVVVRAAETTELVPLTLPETGAVSLRVSASACAAASLPWRLVVRRAGADGALAAPLWQQEIGAPPCDRQLEGLEAGRYEAAVSAATEGPEVMARASFSLQAGEKAEAKLWPAEVQVTGRLTLGEERPAPGLTLVFEIDGQTWTARSDENGAYGVSLGPAADYRISVPGARGRMAAVFDRRFEAGEQTADFALSPAEIRVRARRDDGGELDEEVQVALTSAQGQRITAQWRPAPEAERRLGGLELGEYWITASSASGLRSQECVHVALTPEEPVAEADLVLGRHDGLLEVVNELGTALVESQVESRESLLPPVRPGVFALGSVPMGEWLKARSTGYLAACRILQPADLPALRIALSRATDWLTLRLDTPLAWEAGTLEVAGSGCPIALADVEAESQTQPEGTIVRLRLPKGSYRLAIGAASQTAEVPGPDVRFPTP